MNYGKVNGLRFLPVCLYSCLFPACMPAGKGYLGNKGRRILGKVVGR